jgi:SAM-dependent methyltransferase
MRFLQNRLLKLDKRAVLNILNEVLCFFVIRQNNKARLIRRKVYDYFRTDERRFGKYVPYQSFDVIGLRGQRNTRKRLSSYPIDFIRNTDQVLDLGCNMGGLLLTLSTNKNLKQTKFIGIDIDSEMIEIANILKEVKPNSNVSFLHRGLDDFVRENQLRFDFIFALAVDYWVGDEIDIFFGKLSQLAGPNGKVLLESNNMEHEFIKLRWENIKKYLSANKNVIMTGALFDDCKREWLLYSN